MKKLFRSIFRPLLRPHWKKGVWLLAAFGIWYASLPDKLFQAPYSTVLEDAEGNLLGARIAADGQWRFPPLDTVPDKFAQAIVTFEDNYFYDHPGVNPMAIGRAMVQNIRNGRVVSGGSTLTMQVVRLSKQNPTRSVVEKLTEIFLATRIEAAYSKAEILAMYTSHAPFGGNVVGLDAAAWRYFGRRPDLLSWAESATLAVLPNSPALIHPGRNRDALRAKRDRLLVRMYEADIFDSLTCTLAMQEPLPEAPHALPQIAPHLLDRVIKEHGPGTRLKTTLNVHLQTRTASILNRHYQRLSQNGIHNASALVLEVKTGNVLVYQGNVATAGIEHGNQVDIIRSRRSTGSILKPFLYASMLDDGELLPNTLIPDVPTYFGSYSPKNYNHTYDGVVPAHRALARSLNIPAIRMLHQYGHQRFHHRLTKLGLTTLDRSADHYGLSLILGGAEATLWDLAGMYASMARTVNHYPGRGGKYLQNGFHKANYAWQAPQTLEKADVLVEDSPLGAAASFLTFQAMLEVTRPNDDKHWEAFSSSRKIAWKTGTSYGYRDAWAIGCNPQYVVAVWAGNADGEGRPGLVGLQAAAPILFDIFDMLPGGNTWFETPYEGLETVPICKQSGHRASEICPETMDMAVPLQGMETQACPYHQLVHLDETGQFRLHSDCASPFEMEHKAWFVLPPSQEEWYRKKYVNYVSLPPYRADCAAAASGESGGAVMEFVYPRDIRKVYVPVNLDGSLSSVVFEIAHRETGQQVHWHLDETYMGNTKTFHQMALNPQKGKHLLTLVDESGNTLKKQFEVIAKD